MDKWLLRATIWCPISPKADSTVPQGAQMNEFYITPGYEDEEIGKIRFIPKGELRIVGKPQMDSRQERCLFDVEVIIQAEEIASAVSQSREYLNSKLDLLAFLTMRPCEVINYQNVTNLSQQRLYDQGHDVEGEMAFFGELRLPESVFPPVELLFPRDSDDIKRALRWFRKGVLLEPGEDRFLCYYIALEAISDTIKKQEELQHVCKHCGKETGIPKSHTDGIKFVLTDILHQPQNMFGKISTVRAKITHGVSSKSLRAEVDLFLPLTEKTVVAALKHVLGLSQDGLPQPGMKIVDPFAESILTVKYRHQEPEGS